jgi:apolipoprotein N-acyltransferase
VTKADSSMPPPTSFRIREGVAVVFGGQRGSGPVYQSAFSYDGKWHYADKTRLVIFGEYVPGRNWIPFLSSFSLPQGDLTPGERLSTLKAGDVVTGPVICFEALFPDVSFRQAMQGAQVLTVLSIDDWYMGTGAPDQLKAACIWRSVETGLPVLRSASLGYTFATDTKGRVLAEAPLGQRFALRVEVPHGTVQTFPAQPVFPIACLGVVGYLLLLPWLPKKSAKA